MASVGDPCTTADGRSGYLVASGDDATLVCQVPSGTGTETVEFYQVTQSTATTTDAQQIDPRD